MQTRRHRLCKALQTVTRAVSFVINRTLWWYMMYVFGLAHVPHLSTLFSSGFCATLRLCSSTARLHQVICQCKYRMTFKPWFQSAQTSRTTNHQTDCCTQRWPSRKRILFCFEMAVDMRMQDVRKAGTGILTCGFNRQKKHLVFGSHLRFPLKSH